MKILNLLMLISLLTLSLTEKILAKTICFMRDDTIVCYQKESPNYQKGFTTSKKEIEKLIREKALKIGVNPDLAVKIAYYESRLNQSAISSKGAIGVMQIMPHTARELGINPYDLHENIEGGLRYFKMLLERFGNDIKLALAAYNAGPNSVKKFGGTPPYKETINYVANISGSPTSELTTRKGVKKNNALKETKVRKVAIKVNVAEEGIIITNRE